MKREYHRWYSPALERDMELLIFGHAGARVLVFPTSKGRYYEWEDRGMMAAFGEHLSRGWLQMICVDSVDAESWYARYKHPGARAWRQEQYDHYLLREVLPLSTHINPTPFLMTVGASFGAYHAMSFGLRHPGTVNRIIGLSGIYDIERWTDGFYDELVHAHNPVAFITHEHDPGRIAALQRQDIIIAIGNALRLWDGWAHDWPYWTRMLQIYINGAD